jgi:hypothetical protein
MLIRTKPVSILCSAVLALGLVTVPYKVTLENHSLEFQTLTALAKDGGKGGGGANNGNGGGNSGNAGGKGGNSGNGGDKGGVNAGGNSGNSGAGGNNAGGKGGSSGRSTSGDNGSDTQTPVLATAATFRTGKSTRLPLPKA